MERKMRMLEVWALSFLMNASLFCDSRAQAVWHNELSPRWIDETWTNLSEILILEIREKKIHNSEKKLKI